MKKLICILILLGLVAMAAIVPSKIRKARVAYETRMVAIVTVIQKHFSAAAPGNTTTVAIYAPNVESQNGGGILSTSGIVELKTLSGRQQLSQFSARIRNECKSRYDPECLRIETFSLSGDKSARPGEPIYLLPTLPMQPNEQEADANDPQAGANGPAASGKNPATAKPKAMAQKQAEPKQAAPKAKPEEKPKSKTAVAEPEEKSKSDTAEAEPEEIRTGQLAKAEPPEKPISKPAEEQAKPKPAAQTAAAEKNSESAAQPDRAEDGATTPETPAPAAARRGSNQTELSERFPSAPPTHAQDNATVDSSNRVLQIQRALQQFGYDPGRADNVAGRKTRAAILRYQRLNGLEPTGEPSLDLLRHMMSQSPSQQRTISEAAGGSDTASAAADGQQTDTASLAARQPTDQIAEIQRSLQRFGYDPGQADNVVGRKTRSAILAYQRRNGLEPTGEPSLELLNHMKGISNNSNTP